MQLLRYLTLSYGEKEEVYNPEASLQNGMCYRTNDLSP